MKKLILAVMLFTACATTSVDPRLKDYRILTSEPDAGIPDEEWHELRWKAANPACPPTDICDACVRVCGDGGVRRCSKTEYKSESNCECRGM